MHYSIHLNQESHPQIKAKAHEDHREQALSHHFHEGVQQLAVEPQPVA